MKKFFVCRAVNRKDGSVAAPVESFDTRESAESTFYTRCGQACTACAAGDSVTEAVIFFDAEGFVLDHKGWSGVESDTEYVEK